MKKVLFTRTSPISSFFSGRQDDSEMYTKERPGYQLTKVGLVLVGFVVLAVLSIVGWGYGVLHNGAFSGLPKRHANPQACGVSKA